MSIPEQPPARLRHRLQVFRSRRQGNPLKRDWRWSLYAANGSKVARSARGYSRRIDALDGARSALGIIIYGVDPVTDHDPRRASVLLEVDHR